MSRGGEDQMSTSNGPAKRRSLRSSSRPSLFKIMDPASISEHFGVSLSDSSSDEEFTPGASDLAEENSPVSDDDTHSDSEGVSEDGQEEEEEEDEEGVEEGGEEGERDAIAMTPELADVVMVSEDESIAICTVCLETTHDNDIVTCDSCGLSVHEGCYGVPEDDGVDETQSNISSFSTIPWFCDPCKANVKNPSCDLCPVEGGLFKQAINGEWVHAVCSLYCEGVEYIKPSLLSGLTLDGIPPSRWGARTCQLCDDSWLSQTGICIQCDAGLCKVFFHATCGQKNGLLCEADNASSRESPTEPRPGKRRKEEITDLYFAHCLAHSDKKQVKRKKLRYSKAKESVRRFKRADSDSRLEKYLAEAKDSYDKMYNEMKAWYQPDRIVVKQGRRLLHSHPEAFKLLTEKAQLLGYAQDCVTSVVHSHRGVVPIGLTEEFVKFFNSRRTKHSSLKAENEQLLGTQSRLKEKSLCIQDAKKKVDDELMSLKEDRRSLTDRIFKICTLTNEATGKSLLDPSKYTKDIVHDDDDEVGNHISGHTPQRCCVCQGCHDDYLMVQCDTCDLHYHITCLDPPLSRVPQKTSRYGWQCEECCLDSEDELKPAVTQNSGPQSRFGRKINNMSFLTNSWQYIEVSPVKKGGGGKEKGKQSKGKGQKST